MPSVAELLGTRSHVTHVVIGKGILWVFSTRRRIAQIKPDDERHAQIIVAVQSWHCESDVVTASKIYWAKEPRYVGYK
ncbi:MAG: hypothetical protein K8L99_15115 [Anaerolineae bacterium]|nr:hypothetical protein [Anaerolineae bacterium]